MNPSQGIPVAQAPAAQADKMTLVNRARLAAEMRAAQLDALIVCSPVNVFYLTRAFMDDQRERVWDAMLQVVVWPLEGDPVLIASLSAEGQARRSTWFGDVRTYEWPTASPVPALARVLEEKRLHRARLGLELTALPAATFTALTAAVPAARVAEAGLVLERTRAAKTPGEVALLRELARKTERAIEETFLQAHPGEREREVAVRLIANLLRHGAHEARTPWLGVGANATTRRRRASDDPLVSGEVVRVDFGGWLDGFASDITRMAVVGSPSPRQEDMYARVRDVQLTLFDAMKPGVLARDVHATYRQAVEKQGLPFAGGIVAHSIGARVHEYPVIRDETLDAPLEAGMVMAVEPTVTLPREAKYTIEDLVLVTQTGAVRLSDVISTSELLVIPGS
ncbi:MAG TPA: Xaa-Pro peptidase family protein [Methylomirabilota bacterium]|jgi:Xaa-Pro aminopeptidase|nr:Xaa-Pro peptidase family protein [Methylomirabilota bacterium]